MEHLYGLHSSSSTQDYPYFPDVDDLLDLSNDQIFSNSSSSDSHPSYYAPPPPPPPPPALINPSNSTTTDFPNDLCLPSEDVAELEWLSRFVDDSFTHFPAPVELSVSVSNPNNSHPNLTNFKPETIHRCTHCASEKTPQWRTGPLGPKTLCNACGVRYKSGRLVPEYRPAASPTFVLTQHSNSHRKVMELRRKKEASSQQLRPDVEEQHQGRFYLHPNGYGVC